MPRVREPTGDDNMTAPAQDLERTRSRRSSLWLSLLTAISLVGGIAFVAYGAASSEKAVPAVASSAAGLRPAQTATTMRSDAFEISPLDAPGVTTTTGVPTSGVETPLEKGSWRALSDGRGESRFNPVAVWTGDEPVIYGAGSDSLTATITGWTYVSSSDRLRSLPISPLDPKLLPVGVWTGNHVVVCCGMADVVVADRRVALYDPAADAWRVGADGPSFHTSPTAVWADNRMFVLARRFASYDPINDEWTVLQAPPYGNRFSVVWLGDKLFAWPRFDRDSHGPLLYDPAADTWEALDMPLLVRDIDTPSLVWTGAEVIAVGVGISGSRNESQLAAAWNPVTNQWRVLPDIPLGPVQWGAWTPGAHDAVWTGSVMYLWVGALDDAPRDDQTNLLSYDPDTSGTCMLLPLWVIPLQMARAPS